MQSRRSLGVNSFAWSHRFAFTVDVFEREWPVFSSKIITQKAPQFIFWPVVHPGIISGNSLDKLSYDVPVGGGKRFPRLRGIWTQFQLACVPKLRLAHERGAGS